MVIALIALFTFCLAVIIFVQQPKFGKIPAGERLARIQKSPHFKGGKFSNLSPTPDLTEGSSIPGVLWKFLFARKERIQPSVLLPSAKTDLLALHPDENLLVWFGHSSYFMQIDGKKILVDPVLSGTASPLGSNVSSFKGSDIYTTAEIPEIDILFITHDHWDHLDYKTMLQLKPKINRVICGLGSGAHLEHWGFAPEKIIEKAWDEDVDLGDGFVVNVCPARHFSGRGLVRNKAMWVSYALTTPSAKIFIGGDSGYDTHFAEIGEAHGPFDLAILECGQYDQAWKYIHMMPEEVVQAARELKAESLFAVHWGKFALANHAWDEPIARVAAESERQSVHLVHPMIGEPVRLNERGVFARWWEGLG